jgi:hypothetical protein
MDPPPKIFKISINDRIYEIPDFEGLGPLRNILEKSTEIHSCKISAQSIPDIPRTIEIFLEVAPLPKTAWEEKLIELEEIEDIHSVIQLSFLFKHPLCNAARNALLLKKLSYNPNINAEKQYRDTEFLVRDYLYSLGAEECHSMLCQRIKQFYETIVEHAQLESNERGYAQLCLATMQYNGWGFEMASQKLSAQLYRKIIANDLLKNLSIKANAAFSLGDLHEEVGDKENAKNYHFITHKFLKTKDKDSYDDSEEAMLETLEYKYPELRPQRKKARRVIEKNLQKVLLQKKDAEPKQMPVPKAKKEKEKEKVILSVFEELDARKDKIKGMNSARLIYEYSNEKPPFSCQAQLRDKRCMMITGHGIGQSKKEAKLIAAQALLKNINSNCEPIQHKRPKKEKKEKAQVNKQSTVILKEEEPALPQLRFDYPALVEHIISTPNKALEDNAKARRKKKRAEEKKLGEEEKEKKEQTKKHFEKAQFVEHRYPVKNLELLKIKEEDLYMAEERQDGLTTFLGPVVVPSLSAHSSPYMWAMTACIHLRTTLAQRLERLRLSTTEVGGREWSILSKKKNTNDPMAYLLALESRVIENPQTLYGDFRKLYKIQQKVKKLETALADDMNKM